jgi:hypothetical protein
MESDHPEPDVTEPAAIGADLSGAASDEASSRPTDPAALVERLIAAGDWPEPELLEQIVAAGDAALRPLLDFMRTYPQEYEREGALYNGIGILAMIRSPDTIPVLVEIVKRYAEDSGQLAAEVLGDFGAEGFEPALAMIRDPEVTDYPRQHAIEAAVRAAGADPALRARLADVLRPLLADALERSREAAKEYASEPDEADDEEDEESEGWVLEDFDEVDSFDDEGEDDGDLDEDDVEELPGETASSASVGSADRARAPDLEPHEELMFLITDLAALADPQARGLIKTAFEEDLVETFWVDEKSIEKTYREGGEKSYPPRDWLEDYRDRYKKHIDYLNRPPSPPRPLYSTSHPMPPGEPPRLPPQETIRNTGPKLGRNDPCWCGSGKKYKKCHLGKDGMS